MMLVATINFQESNTMLSFDSANSFNSISRHRMLPALAETIPVATGHAINVYPREDPKQMFAVSGRRRTTEVILPAVGYNKAEIWAPCVTAQTP